MASERDNERSKTYNANLHQRAKGHYYRYGRELRQKQTNAEKILWEHLKNRKLSGLKFRRQHPLGTYVPDFYCHDKKVIIEVDGKIHLKKNVRENDREKDWNLKAAGFKILRFKNEEIENEIENVLKHILNACNE